MPTAAKSVREIVSTQPTAAAILLRFAIDLCSQAEMPLEDACAELHLSVDQVLEKLADADNRVIGAPAVDLAGLSAGRLIRHIVRVHHQRVRQELPKFAEMARKLADKRADRAPELKDLKALVEELHTELFAHIQKEERILFPFIAQMEQDLLGACPPFHARFPSVAQPIRMMMLEHDAGDRIMEELRRLTRDFEPPAWACATHIALYGVLRAFKLDLEQHVHLENDVLFPRAIEMESALNHRG
jgi:regulator of cell morphogenesis and NO signaling